MNDAIIFSIIVIVIVLAKIIMSRYGDRIVGHLTSSNKQSKHFLIYIPSLIILLFATLYYMLLR